MRHFLEFSFVTDLLNSFKDQQSLDPNRICCSIQGEEFSYLDVSNKIDEYSVVLNVLLRQLEESKNYSFAKNPRIGVVIEDSLDTYSYIITCLIHGCAFVPIQPTYPQNRIQDILDMAELDAWFGPKDTPVLSSNTIVHLNGLIYSKEIKGFTSSDFTPTFREENQIKTDSSNELISQESTISTSVVHQNQTDFHAPIAYILFTSGTTGKPKGVPISYSNLQHFYEGFLGMGYSLNTSDRFLQMFELTFDLSVSSFLIPLCLGASFHTLNKSIIKPLALYDVLESQNITFALMVPSAVELLSPYADDIELPQLKYTQFCGEAFKMSQLNTWSNCCPNTQIDNVYGPTEATIYCTRYTAYPLSHPPKQKNGIVCIGTELKHVELKLGDNNELQLGGKQTTSGYLKATPEQQSRFENGFYLSGDTAEFDGTDYFCLGRMDDQVKVQGYRVELSELEFAANQISPNTLFKAVAYKSEQNTTLHLFYTEGATEFHTEYILSELKMLLPWYMVPHQVHKIDAFPLNANGKIDKAQLIEQFIK